MTARRAGAVLAAATLLGTSAAAASPTGPEDFPAPTSEQLARSVTVYTSTGSTTVYDLSRAVRALASTRREAAVTVVSLDSDILFAFGSATLSPQAAARIGELVAAVPQGAAVDITGHTDAIGEAAANLRLSEQRARAVAAAVTAARKDLRLTVTGRGEAEPAAPNTQGGKDDPQGRQQNRRVEIRYSG